jgi:putative flippase GtrA
MKSSGRIFKKRKGKKKIKLNIWNYTLHYCNATYTAYFTLIIYNFILKQRQTYQKESRNSFYLTNCRTIM